MAPDGRTLTHCFNRVVEDLPDRTAVTSGESRLTYRELGRAADVLAGRLLEKGVRKGSMVGLFAPRGPELLIGMLGILKAGGAYLPIDPGYPQERVLWMLRDSASSAVVTTAELAGELPGPEAGTVLLDRLPAAPDDASYADLPDVDSTDLAYVIYTSGSTGMPKGVQVEHHSVIRLFGSTREWFGFGRDDVWTAFHSAAFDFSVWEIWGALLSGGRLVMVPQATARSPEAFHGLLLSEGVTVLNQTPSAFRRLAAVDARAPHPVATLRTVVLGGEKLDPATLRPWVERHGDAHPRLVNMYGITEATVHASYRPLHRADLDTQGPSPIGEPLPDLTFEVRGEDALPVAEGVPGELYIAGPGLARGYLGRPELDKERFPELPGPDGLPRRYYRTGDRVLASAGGGYGYLGRTDDQLKIRGYRVEPAEIESLLVRHPDVSEAVVLPHDYGEDDVRLIAHVAAQARAHDGGTALVSELSSRAATELPPHMRPSRYTVLPELPLSLNGKVDRAKLPSPQGATSVRPPEELSEGGPELTGGEARIAEIWRTVLDVPLVDRDADFFDLGGTSLSLLRMFSAVNEAFGTDLDITVLIDGATVGALAQHIDAALTTAPAAE